MGATSNLDFVKQVRDENQYTHKQLSDLSGYSEEYVRSWFAKEDSSKFRTVPDRAVKIMKLQLASTDSLT